MPKRKVLNARQQRVLARMRLMPLTYPQDIAARFGIPKRKVYLAQKQLPSRIQTRYDVAMRFRGDPAREGNLVHPKLWWMSRTIDLVPQMGYEKVYAQLLREANEKGLSVKELPPLSTFIQQIIALKLRDPEDTRRIQLGRKRKPRPMNDLTAEQKTFLQERAIQFYSNRTIRNGKGYTGEDMRAWMVEYAIQDIPYLRVSRNSSNERLLKSWFAYLAKASRYYQLNAYKRIHPKRVFSGDMEKHAAPAVMAPITSIEFSSPLTPRQREVWDLLSVGTSRKEIAQRLNITFQGVAYLISNIRKKIIR